VSLYTDVVRGTRAVLTVLAVATFGLAASPAKPKGYAPKWRVGDWWVTKTQVPSVTGHGWRWQLNRYDVLSSERVAGCGCLVLQVKFGDTTPTRDGARYIYYVRADDYVVIRQVEYSWQAGSLVGPTTFDFPEGVFGDLVFGQQLPQFPLGIAAPRDSTFYRRGSGLGMANVRQFAGAADSASLAGYLGDPEPRAGAPVKPRGSKLFSVLSEWGAPRESGGPDMPYTYSLQLWCGAYPWRLYSEWGKYWPRGSSTRRASRRSWLIASGHKEK